MPVLTDITQAVISTNKRTINGKIVSRPTLYVADPVSQRYVCDVDIAVVDSKGLDQSEELQSATVLGSILKNVPVARNNENLLYADVGNPVVLTRTDSGQWEVTGFSTEMPGTFFRVAVDLGSMTLGPIQNLSITTRLLTLGEIGLYAGKFGVCPFGESGVFVGGVLQYVTKAS